MRILLLLTLLFCTCGTAAARPESADLRAKLDTHVRDYSLSANGLADALAKTSKEFRLPMGLEWVKDQQALLGLARTWKDETPRQILHSIVEAYPGYLFEVEGDLVHVYREDMLSASSNFLNLMLPESFDVHREPAGLVNQGLRTVVQNIVSPRYLPPGAGEGGEYATGIEERPLSLDVRGFTVRQVLNKLAALSEHNIWVVTFSDTSELTPTGFRRTETLWHPSPFPNTQQPMWDFIAWKEYAPARASP